jgi:hypothetical protein
VATTKTISFLRKPSISVRSWLTIECSTPEPGVRPALRREGVDLVEDHHRRRALPRLAKHPPKILLRFPTHFDFSSGPDTMITLALMAVAIALAKYVFPVPGGPWKITPRGSSDSIAAMSPSLPTVSFLRIRSMSSSLQAGLHLGVAADVASRSTAGSSMSSVTVCLRISV